MAVTYIDPKEFQEKGYLQEVNRRLFFHPLGLALEITQLEEDGPWTFRGIWNDERGDPGLAYSMPPDPAKAALVEAARCALAVTRTEKFGWAIQPVGVGLPTEEEA